MFFLLRMAFWVGLVCVLLPGGNKQAAPDSQINATQAVTLASAAVADMRGFCERQPDACAVGGKVAVALGHKAEAGARTIFEFVTATISESSKQKPQKAVAEKPVIRRPAVQKARYQEAAVKAVPASERGTLTTADIAPAWHAPVPMPRERQAPNRFARAN